MQPLQLWWRELRIALLLFVPLAAILAASSIDLWIAHRWFFDEARSQWISADSWWTNELLHTGGRWAIRCVAVLAVTLWIAGAREPRLQALRRPAAYFSIALISSIAIVGLLKALTNVDCPYNLAEFGGRLSFVHLFGDRPDALPHARCFPAAHASSGYALLALYFALRERSRRLARLGLALGLSLGLIFGLAQQSRGAHFVSHDLWSAFLVWTVSLTLYAFAFKARLWGSARVFPRQRLQHEVDSALGWVPAGGTTDLQRRAGATAGTQRR